MKSNAGSPNYCWEKAGYRIERVRHKNTNKFTRKIYDQNDRLVIEKGGYDGEMKKIHELGIYSG